MFGNKELNEKHLKIFDNKNKIPKQVFLLNIIIMSFFLLNFTTY